MTTEFQSINLTGWILLGVLVALAAIFLAFWVSKQRWTARMLSNAAICLALSFVLSYIKIFDLPQGGAVTAASLLPLIAFAYGYGAVPGLAVGIAYGFLQMIQAPEIVGAVQAVLDYPLAFGAIALAGLARKLPDRYGWLVGIALVGVGRFVCHTLSGVVFFADYAQDSGLPPLVYSLSYNSFVFVDLVICAVVMAVSQVRATFKRMAVR